MIMHLGRVRSMQVEGFIQWILILPLIKVPKGWKFLVIPAWMIRLGFVSPLSSATSELSNPKLRRIKLLREEKVKFQISYRVSSL